MPIYAGNLILLVFIGKRINFCTTSGYSEVYILRWRVRGGYPTGGGIGQYKYVNNYDK